jgi:hypothetical protein
MRPKWGSYVAVLVVLVVFVAIGITSALSYSRTAGTDFLQPIPAYASPLVYSDAVTSWCGDQSTQGLADRFGVAPTAEAAARAVADEARNSRRDPYWFAAYEGCLRGLKGGS